MRAIATAERIAPLMGVARWRVRDPRLAQRVWGLRFLEPGRAWRPATTSGAGASRRGRPSASDSPRSALSRRSPRTGTRRRARSDSRPTMRSSIAWASTTTARRRQRIGSPNGTGAACCTGSRSGSTSASRRSPRWTDAGRDYVASLDRLWPYADYIVVNVSSPNTPGLRELQESVALGGILEDLVELNRVKASLTGSRRRPILVKLAPDLTDAQFDATDRPDSGGRCPRDHRLQHDPGPRRPAFAGAFGLGARRTVGRAAGRPEPGDAAARRRPCTRAADHQRRRHRDRR